MREVERNGLNLEQGMRTSAGESCVSVGVDEDLHVEHISRLDLPPTKDEERKRKRKQGGVAMTYVVEDEDALENDYVRAVHRRRLLEPAHNMYVVECWCSAWNVWWCVPGMCDKVVFWDIYRTGLGVLEAVELLHEQRPIDRSCGGGSSAVRPTALHTIARGRGR